MFWPFPRSSARDPTIKVVRGTVAMRKHFQQLKGLGSCYGGVPFPLRRGPFPLRGHWFPLRGDPFPLGASSNCLIIGSGLGAFNCQGFGVYQECRTARVKDGPNTNTIISSSHFRFWGSPLDVASNAPSTQWNS